MLRYVVDSIGCSCTADREAAFAELWRPGIGNLPVRQYKPLPPVPAEALANEQAFGAWSRPGPSQRPFAVYKPYLRTVTGVPTLTAAKKRFALDPGIRIQPCDAG
jgi:hypothetical protein